MRKVVQQCQNELQYACLIRLDEPAKAAEKCVQVCKGGKLEKRSVMNVKKQEHFTGSVKNKTIGLKLSHLC